MLSAQLLLRGGQSGPRRGGVQKQVGPALQGKECLRDDLSCVWQGVRDKWAPGPAALGPCVSEQQVAGFRTFFPPTRHFVCALLNHFAFLSPW